MADIHKRPGTVVFVAVVLFVFGTAALLASGISAASAAMVLNDPKPFNPEEKLEPHDPLASARFLVNEIPGYSTVVFVIAGLDVLLAVALFACGVGVLRLNPASRKRTIVLMVARLVYSFAYQAYSAIVLLPAVSRIAELQAMEMPAEAKAISGVVTQVFAFGALGCEVFINVFVTFLVIYLLNTATVKAAFAGVPEATPSEEPTPRSEYMGYEDEDAGHA